MAGDDFTAPIVAAALACDVTDVETRCDAFARAQRFLRVAGSAERPDGTTARRYVFTHELYRHVVYADMPQGYCVRLHQRIGEALEAAYGAPNAEIAPQLATHFERAGDSARALHYLTVAAGRARQRFSPREVIGYLDAALTLVARWPTEDERRRKELELRLALGTALNDRYGFAADPVRENYERATELCTAVGRPAQLSTILYARWYVHAMRAERDEATAIATELEGLAGRHGTAKLRVLAASVLARTALYDGRFADVCHHMQRVRACQRRAGPTGESVAYGTDPVIAARVYFAIALWFLGHPGRAQTSARATIAHARASGHVFTLAAMLTQAAFVELLCRNTTAGMALAAQAASLSAEHGFAFWNAAASVLHGWASVQQARVLEAAEKSNARWPPMQLTGARFFSAFAYAFLAEGWLRPAAPLTTASLRHKAGLAIAHTTLDRAYEPELWRIEGELLLASTAAGDRWPEAERCLQRALELARTAQAKSLELRAATSLARAWRARGRTADAGAVLGSICQWFGVQAGTPDLVEARALLAELSG